jgi:hypothetical protein
MTPRAWIQLIGPAITLFGIALSIWGTFLLTRWYHIFGHPKKFAKAVSIITFLVLTNRMKEATQFIEVATEYGKKLNEEHRAQSMVGLCLIFVGFVVQAVGALCWEADMIWGIVTHCS